jgi:hypothetical protein
MMNAEQMRAVGSRIGSQCGPGEFARDNQGIVIAIIPSNWGDQALVLMDAGGLRYCTQVKTRPGIGWHYVNRPGRE